MKTPGNRRVVAVVADLFFQVKIADAAKKAFLPIEFVKDADSLLEKAKTGPSMIVLDLNLEAADPVSLIAKLKSSPETKDIDLIGFVSHVQGELKQKAIEAGCDMVLARSAFSQNLPAILKRHSGNL